VETHTFFQILLHLAQFPAIAHTSIAIKDMNLNLVKRLGRQFL